jgi:LacI family transcriptional regulator
MNGKRFMKVTIKDVAKKAGVSPATVSRVVGGYGYVSQATRRKVLAQVEALGYLPDVVARSLVTKSTRTIGLVVTDITNPFFAQLARGVENITWQNKYTLILANTDEEVDREKAIIKAMLEKRVDAFIVVPASSQKAPHLEELVKYNLPLVLLDRNVQDLAVDTVLVDNENGAYQAVSHLVRLGHKRIGMLLDNLDISTNIERLNGYRRALIEGDLQVEDELIQSCQYTRQSAYELVASMIKDRNRPTALFTANNFMTIGALRAIHEGGLRIPQDIAMVGFDELEWILFNSPFISTVAQPVSEIGELAGQRILARINGETSPPMEIRLKTKFVVRDSYDVKNILSNNSI